MKVCCIYLQRDQQGQLLADLEFPSIRLSKLGYEIKDQQKENTEAKLRDRNYEEIQSNLWELHQRAPTHKQ